MNWRPVAFVAILLFVASGSLWCAHLDVHRACAAVLSLIGIVAFALASFVALFVWGRKAGT